MLLEGRYCVSPLSLSSFSCYHALCITGAEILMITWLIMGPTHLQLNIRNLHSTLLENGKF